MGGERGWTGKNLNGSSLSKFHVISHLIALLFIDYLQVMKILITILVTGGTIDSHFDPITESVKTNRTSNIKDYLDGLNLHLTYDVQEICMKDSREITSNDLESIVKVIKSQKTEKFLITHGTYTMASTAQYLQKHIGELKGKTIIITGSLKPLCGFFNTDAPFNLGFSMAAFLYAQPGIYVAMNGHLFQPKNVVKNLKSGRFEPLHV